MAIDVGDAVLTFLADTTNLDEAFTRVTTSAEATAVTVKTFGQTMIDAGKGGSSLADAFNLIPPPIKRSDEALQNMAFSLRGLPAAVEQVNPPLEKVSYSLREAKGEAGLLGEQFGIHLPRHVRSFIAEMPGVGAALSAAFSATAVLFLLEALIKASEKLSTFVADTFIFTEAMKASNASVAATNKTMVELAATAAKDQQALDDFGKSAIELADDKIKRLNDRMKESIALQLSLQNQAKATQLEYSGWDAAIDAVTARFGLGSTRLKAALDAQSNAVAEAGAKATAQIKNQDNIKKELELEEEKRSQLALDLKIKNGQAELANDRTLAAAKTSLIRATEAAVLSLEKDSGAALVILNAKYAEEDYQTSLKYLRAKLDLLKLDPTKNRETITKLNLDIEAEEIRHNTAAVNGYKNLIDTLKAIYDAGVPLLTASLPDQLVNPLAAAFDKAHAAAAAAGVTLRLDLVTALEAAKKAKDDFVGTGIIDPVAIKQFDANIKAAQKTLDDFGAAELKVSGIVGILGNAFGRGRGLIKLFENDLNSTSQAMRNFGAVSLAVYQTFGKAFESAIAGAILSQQSFGEALAAGTAQVAAQIAAQSLIYGLFYTAQGIADAFWNPARAGADFTAAGEFFAIGAAAAGIAVAINPGTSTTSTPNAPGPASPAQTAGAAPTTTANVPHLADGGVVYKRTVLVAGDSRSGGNATEGILPLGNPQAMDAIAGAIADRMGAGSGQTIIHEHHYHIKGDVIDHGQLMKRISREVKRGTSRLEASNSSRITKKA